MTSSSGQISLTGIVMLANPRSIDPQRGNRNIAFDVTVPSKDGNKPSLGLLRYFMPENRVNDFQKIWNKKFTPAFVVTKIAPMPEKGIPPLIEENNAYEYAFIGDISDVIIAENADIQRNPCIIASGTVDESDSANFTFKLTPSQYINLLHNISDCPLSCYFDSESKKWQNKKPMPSAGSTISITGMLTKIKRGFENKVTFEIELDNIAYLSNVSAPSTSASQYSPTSSPPSHYRFNYNTTASSSDTSKLSSVALGKRKKEDDEDPSTEGTKTSRTTSEKND